MTRQSFPLHIKKRITEFAQGYGIDRHELEAFILDLSEDIAKLSRARPTSDKSLDTRQMLREWTSSNRMSFTCKSLAARLQLERVDVNNALRYLEAEGYVQRLGQAPKPEGQKGRAEIIWKSCK